MPTGNAYKTFADGRRTSGLRGYAVGLALILGIAFFYSRMIAVNATTVGFTLLLAILGASAIWGLRVSCPLSVVALTDTRSRRYSGVV